MRESFSDYKKTLESNLIGIPFLYAGDVINSIPMSYTESKNTPLTSPSFMINCILDIYNKSFIEMVNRSKEVVLPEESFILDKQSSPSSKIRYANRELFYLIISTLKGLNIGHNYMFITGNSSLFDTIRHTSNNRPFPSYLYELQRFATLSTDILLSPLIVEEKEETVIYVSDRPIQSLVYSIQNMDYKIEPFEDNIGKEPHLMKWSHTINYPFYNCQYDCYKIVIKNVSEIRQQKINNILNDN